MIGIVVVTHTDYGTRLLKAAELILGEQKGCAAVSVDISYEVAETLEAIKVAAKDLDKGKGVLILTDMFGGTPTNLSLSLLGAGNVEVLTGVNLPMLLKALGSRNASLTQAARESAEAGRQGIVVAGEILRRKV